MPCNLCNLLSFCAFCMGTTLRIITKSVMRLECRLETARHTFLKSIGSAWSQKLTVSTGLGFEI